MNQRTRIDTKRTDALGRCIFVDEFGRRVWTQEDRKRPADKTPDEWYWLLQTHGPVYV